MKASTVEKVPEVKASCLRNNDTHPEIKPKKNVSYEQQKFPSFDCLSIKALCKALQVKIGNVKAYHPTIPLNVWEMNSEQRSVWAKGDGQFGRDINRIHPDSYDFIKASITYDGFREVLEEHKK